MKPLNNAMRMLADAGAIFIGQGVAYDGVAMYNDLDGIPPDRRIEMPVAEELQLGIATGMAMQGLLPVAIYPRFDFLLRAMDQLVNHLDKIEAMSCGQWKPKVIIRTRVGSKKPLHAGPQHTQDHTAAMQRMLTNINVLPLRCLTDAEAIYQVALVSDKSSLVVEDF